MFKSEVIFGKAQALLYSIEWQKRGLPHCHLLWLSADHRITPDEIGDVICVEIPDPSVDPELHQTVICLICIWCMDPVVVSIPIPLACRTVNVAKSVLSNSLQKPN